MSWPADPERPSTWTRSDICCTDAHESCVSTNMVDLIVPDTPAHQSACSPGSIGLPLVLRQQARLFPNKTAFEYVGTFAEEQDRITFAELEQEAIHIAAELQRIEATEQQPALLVYPAGLEFVAAFLGCMMAGAVPIAAPL